MPTLHAEVEIAAEPARIWAVLTDLPSYPDWNPFIRQFEGRLETGGRVQVVIHPPGRGALRFRPILLRVEPERELRWRGHLGIPGLFDGEHVLQVQPLGAGRSRFVQEESFRGILAPLLMRGGLRTATEQGFVAMNGALKSRVEGTRPPR